MNGNQKKAAIVTGAFFRYWKSDCRNACSLGYEDFGFGREFTAEVSFHPVVCDLLDTEELERHIKQIRKQYEIYILINNAGIGYYGLHEELNAAKIKQMVRTNLELPLLLSNLLLRDLKRSKGYLLQISSVTAFKKTVRTVALTVLQKPDLRLFPEVYLTRQENMESR